MNFPFSSYIVPAIFALAVGMTLGGALIAVGTSRLIRAVSGLMICCIGLAGLYYFLNSPFLALMEILIYVGAVCVTIVFAVMLAEPDEPVVPKSAKGLAWGALAAIASGLIGIGLARVSLQAPWKAAAQRVNDGSVEAIGKSLLTTYSLAFEVISLVLLVAILGALVIARSGRSKAPSSPLSAAAGSAPEASPAHRNPADTNRAPTAADSKSELLEARS